MENWIRVAAVADCPPGESREIVAGNRMVALFNVGGQFYALDGICPHQGGPLGQASLCGHVATCPWHGWQFDVRTGQHQTSRSVVHARFPVNVQNEQVYVDVSETP